MSVRDPYYTDFAPQYDRHTSGVAGDVEFYRELAQQASGPVVELGVGTGRVAIPAAQAGRRDAGPRPVAADAGDLPR